MSEVEQHDVLAMNNKLQEQLIAKDELIAGLQEALEDERELRQTAEHSVTSKQRQINMLKGQQLKRMQDDPHYPDACEVLDCWKDLCAPKAKDPYGAERVAVVLARLRKYSVEDLKRCVLGYSLKPYVMNGRGRVAEGPEDCRQVQPTLIFRDADYVDRGIAYANANEAMQNALRSTSSRTVSEEQPSKPAYAARISAYSMTLGFAVFPCKSNAKVPATRNGFQDATKEIDRIVRCWSARPDLNIGVATGQISGIVVVDVDDYKGGGESLLELEQRYAKLPRTLSAVTPRGGQHYYFKHPGDMVPNAVDLVPGIDVRGDGGYVLVPPSQVDGKPYEWDERAPVADMPDWLTNGLKQRKRQARSASYWIGLADGVTAGARNTKMTELVGKMVHHGLPDDLVATLALAVNQRFKPPMDQHEVAMIVRSIVGRHQRQKVAR